MGWREKKCLPQRWRYKCKKNNAGDTDNGYWNSSCSLVGGSVPWQAEIISRRHAYDTTQILMSPSSQVIFLLPNVIRMCKFWYSKMKLTSVYLKHTINNKWWWWWLHLLLTDLWFIPTQLFSQIAIISWKCNVFSFPFGSSVDLKLLSSIYKFFWSLAFFHHLITMMFWKHVPLVFSSNFLL